MSLEILELNSSLRQYWIAGTAYRDILKADSGDDNDSKTIKDNKKIATTILGNWVWASNYKSVRYMLGGTTRYIKQYALKRIYPTARMAKIALANEIRSQDNWNKETKIAKALIENADIQKGLLTISQEIYKYLENKEKLINICKAKSTYWRLNKKYSKATDTWDLLQRVLQKKDDDLVINIVLIHDLSALLNKVKDPPINGFTPFNRATLRMSIWNNDKEEEQVVAADKVLDPTSQLDPTRKALPMRWTLSGGKFPDNRTPNEYHPAVIYARMNNRPVEMGPSRTTADMLHLANEALVANEALGNNGINEEEIKDLLAYLTLGLFAFWNQSYSRQCTMIHCYHFVTDCAIHNFDVPREIINKIIGLDENSDYL